VGAYRKSIDRPSQRADEVQTGAPAVHGGILRNSRGAGRRQGWQAAVVLGTGLESPQRADMVKEAWKRIGKVFILAVVLDVVYQLIVLHFVYPGEALIDTSDVGAPRRITRHITLVVVDHIYVPESLANRMP